MSTPTVAALLGGNSLWAEGVRRLNPEFFPKSAEGQTPHTLWIGCSDSRAPESLITFARPGDIFVHRNIGNQALRGDDNMLAVLDFAVNVLEVKTVVICGHSKCGAVHGAFDAARTGRPPVPHLPADSPVNRWLRPLVGIAKGHEDADVNQLIDLNIRAQVKNIQVILSEWKPEAGGVLVHGLIYDLASGDLRELH
ncbi:carbonic anhydrase [Rhodocollybia butyracea]|uniref:Carbonic anhydrase n=1 Tax=Rhodocollybia butyracea TaxID=206335 RepID=A0A9P5P812_9AGAR|nr:carbonic anhydrase [Rhodocollybia butyracea]